MNWLMRRADSTNINFDQLAKLLATTQHNKRAGEAVRDNDGRRVDGRHDRRAPASHARRPSDVAERVSRGSQLNEIGCHLRATRFAKRVFLCSSFRTFRAA